MVLPPGILYDRSIGGEPILACHQTINPATFNLTSYQNLTNLQVYCATNLNSGAHLYIDSWKLTVTMSDGVSSLNHVLTYNVGSYGLGGTTNYVVNIIAHSSSPDQIYNVSVSKGGANPYTRIAVIGGTSDSRYSVRLPSEYQNYAGTINVKIQSIVSGDWQQSDSLFIDQAYIYAVVTINSAVGEVRGLAVGDINPSLNPAENTTEIAVMDEDGDVFIVRYSYSYASFAGGIVPVAELNTGITNVKELAIGYVIGNINRRVDMMVVTESNAYALDHSDTTLFDFDIVPLNAKIATTLYSTCIGDVNGDKYLDLVGGTTTGYLYLYKNLDGILWQTIQIDFRVEPHGSGGGIDAYTFMDIAMGKLEEG